MKRKSHRSTRHTTTKSVLRLPDLGHAKAAVLNGLTIQDTQRGYRHAIDEFVEWYRFGAPARSQSNRGASLLFTP